MHWHNKCEDYGVAVILYATIGLCIGATIVGTIYDGQWLKWFGPALLIGFPVVASISNSDTKAKQVPSKDRHFEF